MMLLPPGCNFEYEPYAFWENFITEEEIQTILALPEWGSLERGKTFNEDESLRASDIAWLDHTTNIWLWTKLQNVFSEVNKSFFHFELTGFHEKIQLSLYHEKDKGHYTWHTDGPMPGTPVPRKLSMSLLLSDPSEYEGGELLIKPHSDLPIECEPKRGRAWFFPSFTLHCVAPVTKGVRKSLVLWAGGPTFR